MLVKYGMSRNLYRLLTVLLYINSTGSLVAAESRPEILHASLTIVSDYLWRGQSLSRGEPAMAVEVEYVNHENYYFGGSIANPAAPANTPGYASGEVTGYVGYSKIQDGVGFDLGLIQYVYPSASGVNFLEVYAGFDYKRYTFKAYSSSDAGLYLTGRVKFDLPRAFKLQVHMGIYDTAGGGEGYADYGASVFKDDLFFVFSRTDRDTGDTGNRFAVGWSKSYKW